MPCCCVPYCKSRSEKNIRLFALPQGDRNKQRRDQWMRLINRKMLPLHSYVCEFHFTEDQFENNRLDKRRLLKSSAVPTLFPEKQMKSMEADIKDEPETLNSIKQVDRRSNRELKKGNLVKCRTCLLDKNKGNCSIMTKLLYGETIKKMMIRCVPQTFNSIADDNYICDKCLRCLVKCTKFIDSCLEIEEKIRDGKVVFEDGRTDENNSKNLEKNLTEMDSKSKDETDEKKEKNYEEKIEPKSEDEKTDENFSEKEKNYGRKDLSESKNVIEINEDGIESEDSHKIDKKQNELEIKGKRRRKTRKIENSAAEEEIEAYLAEEQVVEKQVKSINKMQSEVVKIGDEIVKTPKFIVKKMKINKNPENVEVVEITLPEIPIEISGRRQRGRMVKREISPIMEIIDKTLGMVVKTYQRKKVVANTKGNGVENQSHSIKKIEEHNESRGRIQLRTYERKRNSLSTTNNNEICKKDHVELLEKTCETEIIDCDVESSVDEHTLGSSLKTDIEIFCEQTETSKSNDDSVQGISVDHDYIVLSEFGNEEVKSITLLDENGELISVDARVEDIESHELPKVDQRKEKIELTCPSCQTHYKTNRGLCYHLEKYHNIKEHEFIYQCQVCKEKITNPKEITKHKNVHGWPCTSCAETFSSEENLNSHKEAHPQIHSCNECGDEFNKKYKLEQHKSMHKLMMVLTPRKTKLPPKRYNCDLCPLVFRHPAKLRVHYNVVHLKLKEYGCYDCGKKFGSKRTLEIHHRVKHQDRKPFHCDLCGDSFKRADYLKKHSLVHRNEQHSIINTLNKTSRGNLFPSELCGMALKKGVGSKKNPYTYSITRKYACDFCGLKFQHQRTKFVHERSHSVDPDKKFICPVCWKRLSTREELDEHSKRHITISKYKCCLCPKAFSRNMLLENHILEEHTSEDKQQHEVKVEKKER